MSTTAAISITDLTKKFGDFTAVDAVNLDIQPGEIFGFLGPNGAGKTTTMRAVLDLIRPTSGSASILGMDCHEQAVEIRRHIGYLPGDLALYPNLTGRETLTYFANLRGGVDWAYVEALAERFKADLSRKVGEYSSGNRQKVGLIQAFMNRPEVLILDEPSTGLDPLVQQEFQALLRELSAGGTTVFLSSHTLSEVERVAGRVGFIRDGKLIAVETVASLRDKAIHRVTMEFAKPVKVSAFAKAEGVRDVVADGLTVSASYEGSMAPLLKAATAHDVISMSSSTADLDEIFLAFYKNTEKASA